jgi:hypothetical protein
MQQLFPLCIHGLLDEPTQMGITCFRCVFRHICSKVLDPGDRHILLEDVAIIMCMLEMTMPTPLFDVMTHLILRSMEELDLCGLVHT